MVNDTAYLQWLKHPAMIRFQLDIKRKRVDILEQLATKTDAVEKWQGKAAAYVEIADKSFVEGLIKDMEQKQ